LVFVERLEPSRLEAEDLDSARLVTAFQAGDRHAFALLYARYFDRVYSFLRFALRSRDEAEDVTQQVFLKTLEALPRYERRAQPFRAWLFTIARNHLRKELLRGARAQQRVELAASALDDGSEEDNAVSAQLRALSWISDPELQMFIERLPLAQRQVLFLRYALDLSHEQTAAVLGRGVLDVRQMQSRALRMLRARLAAVGRGSPHRARPGMVRRRDKSHVLRSRRFALMP
jgi:RNA polymerase sigma-70 factor (ECF subfamily)